MSWKQTRRKSVVIPKEWFGWFTGSMALRVKVALECKRLCVRKRDRAAVLMVCGKTQFESQEENLGRAKRY